MWYRNFCIYHRDIFPVRNYGSFSRGTPWYGSFNSTDDLIRYWYSGNKNCMGVLVVPGSPFAGISVYFISGIMAHYNCDASYLLYMLLEKGMILWNYTDSTGKGVISMYQRVNKGIREKFDLDLKENDIDSILKGENCMYGESIRKRVEEIVTEHVEEMLGMFRECGIDLRSSMTIFVGGGSILLSKIIEDVWKRYDGEYYVVNDSKVNVLGYRKKYLFDIGMQ